MWRRVRKTDSLLCTYDSPVPLGAVALTLEAPHEVAANITIATEAAAAGMLCKWKSDGNELRVLIYSDKGQSMSAGMNRILNINNPDLKIKNIQISSADGFSAPVVFKDDLSAALPKGFSLYQNYPNPFNPATEIAFDLPASCEVHLNIYDILGREVTGPGGRNFPGGSSDRGMGWER